MKTIKWVMIIPGLLVLVVGASTWYYVSQMEAMFDENKLANIQL